MIFQGGDLFTLLQPFATSKLTLDTLVVQQAVIAKNIASTLVRWVKTGQVEEMEHLIVFLIEKAVHSLCLERDENNRAAGLHLDSSSLVSSFMKCGHLLGEMEQCEGDLARFLGAVHDSFQASGARVGEEPMTRTLREMLVAFGEGLDLPQLQNSMGGKFVTSCRFEPSAVPTAGRLFDVEVNHSRGQSPGIDFKGLIEQLSDSLRASPGIYSCCGLKKDPVFPAVSLTVFRRNFE